MKWIVLWALAMTPYRIASAQPLEFEVASVKHVPNRGPFGGAPVRSGDRFTMRGAQFGMILYYAYRLHGLFEVVGELGYGSDEWNSYDIDARTKPDATDDQVRLMAQALLASRFQLKLHRETRELPVYDVTIAKGGPKLRASTDQPFEVTIEGKHLKPAVGTCTGTGWTEGNHLTCHAATLDQVLSAAGGELAAPVTNHTGLTGTYDMDVVFMPANRKAKADHDSAEAIGPSLAQALQEQLGLKMEKGKGPVVVLVIDHFEKVPSEN